MADVTPATGVLLVDDDDTFRRVMAAELARRGYTVSSAATGREALERAAYPGVDVILLDLRLPDMAGIDVLTELRNREVPAGVIVLTGHGTIDTAIQAIRLGAHDYLEKPCPVEKLELAVRKTREHCELVARQRVLQDGYSPPDARHRVVGRSPAFERLRRKIERIAPTGATTLVLGETGTGKEMVAAQLHTLCPRAGAPYVVVDCASLQEDLLLSELFGHEKGAFTGAARQKHGLFEVADGGTLFLDEIGGTSLELQAKLLRVLETGRFRRVGGTSEVVVDVRIVSATNLDLREEVEQHRFREDLFFRLSALTIEVPPLRERREDVPLLVEHFTARFNKRLGLARRFGSDAVDALTRYPWPGNVRELIHVVEQAIVLSDDELIAAEDLPAPVRSIAVGPTDGPERAMLPLREVERRHVLSVLERMRGNRARAADSLGISERNLYRLIKRYACTAAGA